MARVEITKRELESGALPPLCAKSGEPTDHYVAMMVPLAHPRTKLLLVLGVLPYFLWRRFFARRIVARVPLGQPIIDLRRRQHSRLLAVVAVATIVAAVGLLLDDPQARLAVAGAASGVALVVHAMLFAWHRDAHVRFATTRYGTVVLHGIHPAFRAALASGERPTRPGLIEVNDPAARAHRARTA